MLAKDPAARWGSLAEALAALGAVALGEDDPQRVALAQLTAAAGPPEPPRDVTPMSPAPQTRSRDASPGTPAVEAVEGVVLGEVPAELEIGQEFALSASVRGVA